MFFTRYSNPYRRDHIFLIITLNQKLMLPWVICFLRLNNFCYSKSHFPKDIKWGGSFLKTDCFWRYRGLSYNVSRYHHLFDGYCHPTSTAVLYSRTWRFVTVVTPLVNAVRGPSVFFKSKNFIFFLVLPIVTFHIWVVYRPLPFVYK